MTDVTLPGLIVPVEARIDRLEKALKKAAAAQAKAAQGMEQRAKQSADRIGAAYASTGDKIALAFKKFALPFAAGFVAGGVGELAGQFDRVVKSIAEVGDAARRSGVDLEAFQEWKFVAEQNRIGVDALTDGLKELNLRADEFVTTGAGSGADAFKRLGYGAADLKEKLKDPSALLLEIIGRMEKFDAAAQIRIADEVFGGTGGERFAELVAQGEAGLRKTIDRAHEVGAVMDSDMIAKATELDRKFGELSARLDSFFKNAAVSAAEFFGLIRSYSETMPFDYKITLSVAGKDAADALAALPEVSEDARAAIEGVVIEYADLSEEARRLVSAITDGSTVMNGLGNTTAGQTLTDLSVRLQQAVQNFEDGTIDGEALRAKLEEIAAETTATISALSDLDQARLSGITGAVADLLAWIGDIPAKVREAVTAVNQIEGISIPGAAPGMDTGTPLSADGDLLPPSGLAPNASPRPKRSPIIFDGEAPGDTPTGGGAGGGGRGADDYARAVLSLREETAALEAEAVALIAASAGGKAYGDQLEFARKKAELLTDAQRAGKEVTPALMAEIDQLAGAYVTAGQKAEDAADKLKRIQEAGQKAGETLTDMFMGILTGATTAGEALKQLLLDMAKAQLQKQMMTLFTGAPTGSATAFLGGMMGFDAGGYTGDGGRLEPAGVVHRGEFVMSKAAVQRIGVDTLDRLHSAGLRGYAGDGLVGAAPVLSKPSLAPAGAAQPGPVTINAPVTVNATGGTQAQNADLAKQVAAEMEVTMRAVVQTELVRQSRPGGMMNRG